MNTTRVTFENEAGDQLSGILELPLNQEPHNFVLFAHCFTCNKNFLAVKNIGKALTDDGFGVLRFDFTGLGESEGDFAETNFSGNVEDLLAAAAFLEREHQAPTLIIGHSLGGAAVIFAAEEIPTVKAVATIAAPSSPKHVKHLLKSNLEEIKEKGLSKVNVGGRDFTIKEQFLNDLEKKELKKVVTQFNKAIVVLHSPQDTTVEIKNAEEIYDAARHPKSFVSLDGASHLLGKRRDSLYAGRVIASWVSRYVTIPKQKKLSTKHQVVANLGAEGFTTQIKAGNHYFIADEPTDFGGDDFGPSPYELISAALAACTSMTIQMYCKRKEWMVENVETHVNHSREHARDCENCVDKTAKIDTFSREILLKGDVDEKQRVKILEIADKCPVHRTLHNEVQITTKFIQSK